ncbi:tyrosine-type recombinase/integrase [uncultured Sunxiuqinia sp.]|uniref:tyrosine-type recombinase/integrase n=1 Tax=Sunxiuqinia rutila TaxID=1397841 RepID=UPI0026093E3A|nr:site-specific integrase [uncultured Sunxiuqinia sp.]
MPNVYFKVRTKKDDPKQMVSIRIRFKSGKTDQISKTGEKVSLQYWDLSSQKLKRTSFKGKDNLKLRLKNLENHVLEEAAKTRTYPTGWLNDVVDKYLFPEKHKNNSSTTMSQWIQEWIDKSENEYRTIRAYHSTLKSLKEFNPDLTWNDLDIDFYYKFIKYLTGKGFAKNTIASRIKNLKVFCRAALERNIHNNTSYQSFKKQTEESYNIYLSEEELNIISKLNLSSKPYLDKARDIFLIGCWTGCRFSDLDKVNHDNIKGNFIHLEQQKTQKRVVIPLHPVIRSIIEKYDGELPKMISNQKFNDYIKEVCKTANFSEKISKSLTKGGRRETEVKEKWEMVTSHTARRSFATNLYKSGFPSISIMAITGHKTEKAFYSYIKVNEEEHAEMLLKHWESQHN